MAKHTDWISPGEQLNDDSISFSYAVYGDETHGIDPVIFPHNLAHGSSIHDAASFQFTGSGVTKPFIVIQGFDVASHIPDGSKLDGIEVRLLVGADTDIVTFLGPEDAAVISTSLSINENKGIPMQLGMNKVTGEMQGNYPVKIGSIGPHRDRKNINKLPDVPYIIDFQSDFGGGWGTTYTEQGNVLGDFNTPEGNNYHPQFANHPHLGACYDSDFANNLGSGLHGGIDDGSYVNSDNDHAGIQLYTDIDSDWDVKVQSLGYCESYFGRIYLPRLWDGHNMQTEEYFNRQVIQSPASNTQAPTMLYTRNDEAESGGSYYPLYFGGPSETWGFSLPTKTSIDTSGNFLVGIQNTLSVKISLEEWSTPGFASDLRIHDVSLRVHYHPIDMEVATEQFNLSESGNGIKANTVSLVRYFGQPGTEYMGLSQTVNNPVEISFLHSDSYQHDTGEAGNIAGLYTTGTTGNVVIKKTAAQYSEDDSAFRIGHFESYELIELDPSITPYVDQYDEWYNSGRGVGFNQGWQSPVKTGIYQNTHIQLEMDLKDALEDFKPSYCSGSHQVVGVYTPQACCEAGGGNWNPATQFCNNNNPDIAEWVDDFDSEILGIQLNLKAKIGYPSAASILPRDKMRGFTVKHGGWNLNDVYDEDDINSGDNQFFNVSGHTNHDIWKNSHGYISQKNVLLNQVRNGLWDTGWTNFNGSGDYVEGEIAQDFDDRIYSSANVPSSFNGPYSLYGKYSNFESKPICNSGGVDPATAVCLQLKVEHIKNDNIGFMTLQVHTETDIDKLLISYKNDGTTGLLGPFISDVNPYPDLDNGYGLFSHLNYTEKVHWSNPEEPNNGSLVDPTGYYFFFEKNNESQNFPSNGFTGKLAQFQITNISNFNDLYDIIDLNNTTAVDSEGNVLSVQFTGMETNATNGWFSEDFQNMEIYRPWSINPWIDVPIDINGGLLQRITNEAKSGSKGRVKLTIQELSTELALSPPIDMYHPNLEELYFCEGFPIHTTRTYSGKAHPTLQWGPDYDPEARCSELGGVWTRFDISGFAPQGIFDVVYARDSHKYAWEGTLINLAESTVSITYQKKRKIRQTQKIMGYFDRQDPNYDGTSPVFDEVTDVDKNQMQVMDHNTHGEQVPVIEDHTFFGRRFSYMSGNTYDPLNGICSDPTINDATLCMQADQTWTSNVFYDGQISFENAYRLPYFDGEGNFMDHYFYGDAYELFLAEQPGSPALTNGNACWPILGATPPDNSPYNFFGLIRMNGWGSSFFGLKVPDAAGKMLEPFDVWSNWSNLNFGGSGLWTSGTGNGLVWERENHPYGWQDIYNGYVGLTDAEFPKESEATPCIGWENYKSYNIATIDTGFETQVGTIILPSPFNGSTHLGLNGRCNDEGRCSGGRRNGLTCDSDANCPGYSGLRMPAGWNLQGTQMADVSNQDDVLESIRGRCVDSDGIVVTEHTNNWAECMCGQNGLIAFQINSDSATPGLTDVETGRYGPDYGHNFPEIPKRNNDTYACAEGSPTGYSFFPFYRSVGNTNYDDFNHRCNYKSRITSDTEGTGPFYADESDYLSPPSGTSSIYAHGFGTVYNNYVGSNPPSGAGFACRGPGNPFPWCTQAGSNNRSFANFDYTHSHGGDGRWRILQTPNISMVGAKPEDSFLEFWIHMYSDDEEQMGRFFVDITKMDPTVSTPQFSDGQMKFYPDISGNGGNYHGWEPAEMHLYWDPIAANPTHCGKANPNEPNYYEGSCTETFITSDSSNGWSLGLEEIEVFDDPYIDPANQGNPLGKWWLNPIDNADQLKTVRTGRIQNSCLYKDDPGCQWAKVRVPLANFLNPDSGDIDNIIRVQFRYITRHKSTPPLRLDENVPFNFSTLTGCENCTVAGVQGLNKDSNKSDVHIDSVRIVADKINIFETTQGLDIVNNNFSDPSDFGDGLQGTVGGVSIQGQSVGPSYQDPDNGEIDIAVNAGVNAFHMRLDQLIPGQEYQLVYSLRNVQSGGLRPHIGYYEGIYDFASTNNILWTGTSRRENGIYTETFQFNLLDTMTNPLDSKWLWFQTTTSFTSLSIANISVRPLFDLPMLSSTSASLASITDDIPSSILIKEDVVEGINKAKNKTDKLQILDKVADETGLSQDVLLRDLDQANDGLIMGFGRCGGCGFPNRVGVCGPLSGGCWGWDNKKKEVTWDKKL